MYEQIAANKRKTVLLIFGAIVLLGAVGYALGLWAGSGIYGLVGAVALAIVLSLGSFFGGDRLVLASTRAREVTPQEQARLHNIVEGLSIAAGIPKPRVYVIPEQAPNAFATGRNPEHSSVAVTEGLLATMNRVELEGVIGHELSHVVDRDILVGTIVATLISTAAATAAAGEPRRSCSRSGSSCSCWRPSSDRSFALPCRGSASSWPTRRARC